jgi:hypothetical protein
MNIKNSLMVIALLATGTANASTVLMPTDGDVNFLFAPLASGVTLYMFDDDDNNNFAAAADSLLVPIPSIVGISGPQSGDYLASNSNGTLTLTNTSNFVMAVWDANLGGGAGAWVGDSSPVWYGNGNAVQLTFETSGGTLVVDVQPVPVPATVWLFGSGILGLIGIARRKTA